MLAKEIKPGAIVTCQDAPCLIESVNVQSPSARGAATLYKYRARNLITKQKIDITLKGTDALDLADFARRPVKYMYSDPTHFHFLDQENYEQYDLPREDVADESQYLTEDLEGILVLIFNDQAVGIQLPVAVELRVTYCEPSVRGNSATGRTKPATLETGLIIQVPEYLEQGERVKVDTRNGAFLSRA
ncbi:MAG: elongation factor P [Thermoguttaceae bacterium]|jgi:elongation factor P